MRKELLATILISLYWIIAGFFVVYAAWEQGFVVGIGNSFPDYHSTQPDPWALGLILAAAGLVFSFALLRTLLPSRATQRRRLMRLLDDVGVEDIDAIQRKLNAINDEYGADTFDRANSLEMAGEKRKNRAN